MGNAYRYTLTATDEETDALTISAPVKPAWLTLVDHGDGTATLSGTPSAGNAGAQAVTLQVSDGSHTILQSFTINVSNTSVAPRITSITRAENGDVTVCWESVAGLCSSIPCSSIRLNKRTCLK